jgi:hypothetical protein
MNSDITICALIAICLLLINQFYPAATLAIGTLGIVAWTLRACYWLAVFPARSIARRAERRQETQDEKEFWDYMGKFEALCLAHDPHQEWIYATDVSEDYKHAVDRLQWTHREMLQRRNS